jgi:hypothetical protein
MITDSIFRKASELHRRDFVAGAAKCFLGLGTLSFASQLATAQEKDKRPSGKREGGSAESVIYLYMNGGMSHLDTFDTKPGAKTQGPVESIKTSANGVLLSEYLPLTAKQMHHVALVNSLSSNQGAHAQGRYFMHTSYNLRGTIAHPDMGAWASYFLGKKNPMLPSNVKIGGNSSGLGGGFLEAKYAALPIGDPEKGLEYSSLPNGISESQFLRRLERAKDMNERFLQEYNEKQVRAYAGMYDEAVKLMKSKDLEAFDLSKEKSATRDQYGRDSFGQACLLARRLVEKSVRYIEIDNSGWDTHNDNFTRVAEKCAELDQALAALLADLETRDLLKKTLVVVATEFGRTPTIDSDRENGRNHYPQAFSGLLAGGGINGGQKYGKTDKEGREVVEDMCDVTDFNATIAYGLGLPLEEQVYSPSKRPFTVADKGTPVKKLFS